MRPSALLVAIAWLLNPTGLWAGALDDISHRDKLYDLTVTGDHVYCVGYPGLVLHSADRGVNWETVDPGTDDALIAIDFDSKGNGAIVGRSGLVLTSTDSGKTWSRQKTDTKSHLFGVAVIDGGLIWAVGNFGTIIHSANGGKTWQEQAYDSVLPGPPEGEDATVNLALSTAEEENEGAIEEARLNSVRFADAQHGWIVGEFGLILHTADGGQTWNRQRGASGKLLFDLFVKDSAKVTVSGSEGTLMLTEDGGTTWQAIDTGLDVHLLGLWVQGDQAYLAGRDGLIAVYDMNGTRRLQSGLYSWIEAVRFLDEKTGFVVGGRGHLLRTADSGKTWQRLSGR